MTYSANQLFRSDVGVPAGLRVEPRTIQPKTFAAGTGTLAPLTPVAFNTSTLKWAVWTQGTDEVNTLSASGTVSGGTFTITVAGQTTAAIAYNATAAQIQTALEALSNVAPGDVVASGGPTLGDADIVLTWGGAWSGDPIAVSVTTSSITGGGSVVVAETTAGVAATNGTGTIKGFVWPDEIVLDSSHEVIGNVLMEGKVHYDDIPVPSGETATDLMAALRSGPRDIGLIIQGLSQVR